MAQVASADAEHAGTPGYWRLVVVLMAIYTYAFIDRVILALLVDPIKADLGASDVAMGLMLGLAFAVFYGSLSIPAGYYADRVNRRKLIAICSLVWAAMTVVCGLSDTLGQLFLGRMGVGIAEAALTPAAFSLIRDAVPTKSRGLAFSIFAMSPMIGGAISLIGGSALLKAIKGGAYATLPVLGSLEPWQATLVTVGLCGLPVSLLLVLVSEPKRSTNAVPGAEPSREGIAAGLVTAWRYMVGRIGVFAPLILYASFGAMIAFSNSAWLPAAFGRRWHLAPQDVGPTLGLLTLVGGVVGLFCSGLIMNAIVRRGGDIRIYGAFAAFVAAAGIGGAVLAPSISTGYAAAGIGMFFLGSSYAVGATTLSAVTPIAMMGRVSAVYLLFQTLLGQALGPLIVALIGARFSGTNALAYGLALAMAGFALVAVVSALALGRELGRAESAVS